jgi:hypothetical protein
MVAPGHDAEPRIALGMLVHDDLHADTARLLLGLGVRERNLHVVLVLTETHLGKKIVVIKRVLPISLR